MSTSTRTKPAAGSSDLWEDAGALILLLSVGMLSGLVLIVALAGVSISPAIWYLARSAGMTSYLLLWLSVMTGLGLTTRLLGFIGDAGIVMQLHRLATDLAISATAIHLLAVALDPTVEIGMLGSLIPFMSDVRQPWTDVGILTAYGLVCVSLSFAARRWIGKDRWHALHYLTFALWATTLAHAIGGGTDSDTLWAALIYVASATTVVFLLTYHVL